MIYLRQLLIDILIRIAERDIYRTPVKRMFDEDHMDKFYTALWDMPGFQQYCAERETRFVHAQANEWKATQQGQRMENSLLFMKAKKAWEKAKKKREAEALAKGK